MDNKRQPHARLTIRLDEDLREALEDHKWKERTSMNDLVNRILRQYFEKMQTIVLYKENS